MKIKTVEIHNFRTIHSAIIAFHDITTFIGSNGAGKSTILYALDWFFNSSSDNALTANDATYGHENENIEVKVTFTDLTDVDRHNLAKYVSDNSDTFTAWKTRKDGHEVLSANYKGNPDFADIRNCSRVSEKKEKYQALQNEHPELELPSASTNSAMLDALVQWEHEHPEELKEMPEVVTTAFNGFNSNGAMRDLFNYTLVKADSRASEESEDTNSSLLGSIVGRAVDRHKADAELNELYSSISDKEKKIYDATFNSDLDDLSQKLNDIVKHYSRGREVEIKPLIPEIKPPKTNFRIAVKDGEDETVVANQGHGFQRMLLISALQMLAEAMDKKNEQGTEDQSSESGTTNGVLCLAIEEPELYQHPIQAKTFARVLRSLADNESSNMQIIYATHSPYFITARHYEDIYRVLRHHDSQKGDTDVSLISTDKNCILDKVKNVQPSLNKIETQIGEVLANDLSSVIFSNVVIMVEGTSDKAIIEECADRLISQSELESGSSLLGCEGIEILVCSGKNNIVRYAAILESLGIPILVVFDNDTSKKESNSYSKSCPDANSQIMSYFNLTSECGDERWPNAGFYKTDRVSVLVVDDTLETYLERGWKGWGQALESASSETGAGKKNEYTYRLAAQRADFDECPDGIKQIINAALEVNQKVQ